MARTPTTYDVFSAISEPKRRQVLAYLSDGEMNVSELVLKLGWNQPQVSKHLAVLREVGLVQVRRQGRQQVYAMNAQPLKSVHDWVKQFERFWTDHLSRIKSIAEAKHQQNLKNKTSTGKD